MPKLSLIVPVYNGEAVIERCINSILNQDYEDYEAIFLDDGSKDRSLFLLEEYAKKDARIKVISKENTGVSDTRNRGIQEAKGTYIQFMDCDDWLSDVAMKSLVKAMEESDSDLVVADFYRVVGKNVSRKGSINQKETLSLQEYAEWMMESPSDYYYGVLWNKLYKKEIIDTYHIQMDPSLSFCEDFVFNLEYLIHCKNITPLQIPIYYYVKTDGSLVSQNLNIPSIVKMKTNIYEYYNNFFKNILDEKQYANERLNIARFFISAASDDSALPLFPGTKKLGQENVQVYYNDTSSFSLGEMLYFGRKLFEKYLNLVALEFNLDVKSMIVFYGLYSLGKIDSLKQMEDITQFSQAQIILSLQKLSSKGYIKASLEKYPFDISITENADSLCHRLEEALKDIEEICYKDISKETQQEFKRVYQNIVENLK